SSHKSKGIVGLPSYTSKGTRIFLKSSFGDFEVGLGAHGERHPQTNRSRNNCVQTRNRKTQIAGEKADGSTARPRRRHSSTSRIASQAFAAWGQLAADQLTTGMTSMPQQADGLATRLKRSRIFRALGPGLITGAADDDPSGIATYSQAGAQFGFATPWTLLFTYPLMAAIQEISARIGRTTGKGIAANIRQHYPNAILQCIVFLLV